MNRDQAYEQYKRRLSWQRQYRARPEVKKRIAEYQAEYQAEYRARPEVKKRIKRYLNTYYHKVTKPKRQALASVHS